MKLLKNERGFAHLVLLLIIVVAIVASLGFVIYKNQNAKTTTGNASTVTKTLAHPGVVKSEVFSDSLDTAGEPSNPTSSFSATTPNIYVSLGLDSAKASQRVEYTRYLNGKFVDNGSIPVKDGAKYASFNFTLKSGQTRPKGTYVVKTYTNGIFERSATYTVQ